MRKNRLKNLFQQRPKNLLNIYFTAGYPYLNSALDVIPALEKEGVDIVELGMPFSDPLADGPTIQNSGTAALKNGMNVKLLFEQVRSIRKKSEVPIILMGYYNQLMQFGVNDFLDNCDKYEIDGLIIPDLPPKIFAKKYEQDFYNRNLCFSFLITPQTSEERIGLIDRIGSGFLYIVSQSSITGSKSKSDHEQRAYFERLRNMQLKTPTMVGFGIHNRETVQNAWDHSSGAIIGSAFIKAIQSSNPDTISSDIHNFITSLKPDNV